MNAAKRLPRRLYVLGRRGCQRRLRCTKRIRVGVINTIHERDSLPGMSMGRHSTVTSADSTNEPPPSNYGR